MVGPVQALHAVGCPGDRANGDVAHRRSRVGCARQGGRAASGPVSRCGSTAGSGVQQQRARPHAAASACRRGRKAARRRLPRGQAAARVRHARGGSRRGSSGAEPNPGRVALMVDYNQALAVDEAVRRAVALDDEGVYWIEEPLRHDDFAGLRGDCRGRAHAGADRRELLAGARHAEGDRRWRVRLRDARSRAHRRHHRMAACERACRAKPICRCRRTSIPKSARTCWPRRRPPTGWSTWTG